jgi:hypothetical protein
VLRQAARPLRRAELVHETKYEFFASFDLPFARLSLAHTSKQFINGGQRERILLRRCLQVRLQPEPLPVRCGGDPCVSLEEVAEERDILIPNGITDLLHAAMVALQQALCSRDPQLLQV